MCVCVCVCKILKCLSIRNAVGSIYQYCQGSHRDVPISSLKKCHKFTCWAWVGGEGMWLGKGGGGQERSQNACVWGVFVYVKGVQSHRVGCGDNMKANGAW